MEAMGCREVAPPAVCPFLDGLVVGAGVLNTFRLGLVLATRAPLSGFLGSRDGFFLDVGVEVNFPMDLLPLYLGVFGESGEPGVLGASHVELDARGVMGEKYLLRVLNVGGVVAFF